MAITIPILLAGSMVFFFGKKKPSRRRAETRKTCSIDDEPPKGMICKSGILYPKIIDESMLELDDDLTKEEIGIFDTNEEDISLLDDEKIIQEDTQEDVKEDMNFDDSAQRCEEFFQAIYVHPMDDGEVSINKIAVEQTVLPAMKSALSSIRKSFGDGVSADVAAPIMIEAALRELVPICDWKYDEDDYEFKSNGSRVESSIGKDVIYGLFQIADQIIEDFNLTQESHANAL